MKQQPKRSRKQRRPRRQQSGTGHRTETLDFVFTGTIINGGAVDILVSQVSPPPARAFKVQKLTVELASVAGAAGSINYYSAANLFQMIITKTDGSVATQSGVYVVGGFHRRIILSNLPSTDFLSSTTSATFILATLACPCVLGTTSANRLIYAATMTLFLGPEDVGTPCTISTRDMILSSDRDPPSEDEDGSLSCTPPIVL